jgi:hypothetical protein
LPAIEIEDGPSLKGQFFGIIILLEPGTTAPQHFFSAILRNKMQSFVLRQDVVRVSLGIEIQDEPTLKGLAAEWRGYSLFSPLLLNE